MLDFIFQNLALNKKSLVLPLKQPLDLVAEKINTSDWCLIPEILGKYQTTINSIAQELELSQEYLGCEVAEELFNV